MSAEADIFARLHRARIYKLHLNHPEHYITVLAIVIIKIMNVFKVFSIQGQVDLEWRINAKYKQGSC